MNPICMSVYAKLAALDGNVFPDLGEMENIPIYIDRELMFTVSLGVLGWGWGSLLGSLAINYSPRTMQLPFAQSKPVQQVPCPFHVHACRGRQLQWWAAESETLMMLMAGQGSCCLPVSQLPYLTT